MDRETRTALRARRGGASGSRTLALEPRTTRRRLENGRHARRRRLLGLLRRDPRRTQQGLARLLGVRQATICRDLAALGFARLAGCWFQP